MLLNVLGLQFLPAEACLLQDCSENKQPAYVKCFEFFGKPMKEYAVVLQFKMFDLGFSY